MPETPYITQIDILCQVQSEKVAPYLDFMELEWNDFLTQNYLGISLAFFVKENVVSISDPVGHSFIRGTYKNLLAYYEKDEDTGFERLSDITGE